MQEFAFGTLSTPEKRTEYVKERRRGVRHLYRMQPRAPKAGDEPVILATTALDETVTAVTCHILEPEPCTIPLTIVDTTWDVFNWKYLQTWRAQLPAFADGTLVRYKIAAATFHGKTIWADDDTTFAYLVGEAVEPAWASEAVVYQIFPDRFYPGNGRDWNPVTSLSDIYGGTIRGIIDKLAWISDLGINAIWLNPFFPDESHHGYHATDYFSVNPRLGTMDDIRELVSKAHARGIRMILDFVANHWGSKHPTFQAAQKDKNSDYYHWYNWIDWPHDYETFFGVMDLPQINVDYPAARAHLFESVQFWLAEVGFDGLRLDYALGPSHDFWTALRQLVKGINPDIWIFGEVVETPATLLTYEGRMDGCLDFVLMQALRDTFAMGRMNITAFDAFLNQHEQFIPRTFSLPTFLDNHDTNRFLWLAGNDKRKLKQAALCQFTLRGAPIIYNGTEVGVTQAQGMWEPDSAGMEECRRPMPWGDEDEDLLAYYKWLVRFRREHPVLWQGNRRTVHVDGEAGTYAYVVENGRHAILVAFNLSDEPHTLSVDDSTSGIRHTFALSPWGGDLFVKGDTIGSIDHHE